MCLTAGTGIPTPCAGSARTPRSPATSCAQCCPAAESLGHARRRGTIIHRNVRKRLDQLDRVKMDERQRSDSYKKLDRDGSDTDGVDASSLQESGLTQTFQTATRERVVRGLAPA